MALRWIFPIACFFAQGMFLGWGPAVGVLVTASGILALVGLLIMLWVRDCREAQILFGLLSFAPVAGLWAGFLLNKVT